MTKVKNMFGIRSNAQQAAEKNALDAQKRSQHAAEEDAARVRGEASASGRRLRGAGRRALAFMGVESGLASSLAG